MVRPAPSRGPAHARAAILEVASRWWRRRLKLRPPDHVGGLVASSRSRRLNPEVRRPLAGVRGRGPGPRPPRAGGAMAAAAELQGKYQKLAQEYSKVPGARARPRCSASGGRRPQPVPPPPAAPCARARAVTRPTAALRGGTFPPGCGLAGPEPSSRSGAAQGWNAALCGSAKCGGPRLPALGRGGGGFGQQRSCGLAGAGGAQRCPVPAEQQSGLVCKAPSRTAGSAMAGKPS